MRWPLRFLTSALLLSAGCRTGMPVSSPHPPAPPAEGAPLRYAVPPGWFDATADFQASGSEVWLMRNDCAASIEVREIHMDGETRRELDAGGAGRIAPLAIALAGRERAATLIKGPDMVAISGRMFCTWDLVVPASGDSMRVALLDTGRRVYAVTALVPENGKGATTGEVFPVQEDFLGGVRW